MWRVGRVTSWLAANDQVDKLITYYIRVLEYVEYLFQDGG